MSAEGWRVSLSSGSLKTRSGRRVARAVLCASSGVVLVPVGQNQRRHHPGRPPTDQSDDRGPNEAGRRPRDRTSQGACGAGVDGRPTGASSPHLRDPYPGIPRAETGPRAE